jgi:hypothetical protein
LTASWPPQGPRQPGGPEIGRGTWSLPGKSHPDEPSRPGSEFGTAQRFAGVLPGLFPSGSCSRFPVGDSKSLNFAGPIRGQQFPEVHFAKIYRSLFRSPPAVGRLTPCFFHSGFRFRLLNRCALGMSRKPMYECAILYLPARLDNLPLSRQLASRPPHGSQR